MSAPARTLLPYFPRLLREWVTDDPERRWRAVEGSLVLADVSGFTRLSERLARRGTIGAEELSDAIDHCFTRLLRLAYLDGGSLLKFGGDALLLLFTGADHALRACRAAHGMRHTLRSLDRVTTTAGPLTLRMSVGVHSGDVDLFLLGTSHRELVVTGPATTETVRAESAARTGEILLSVATAAAVPGDIVGRAKDGGRLLARRPGGARQGIPPRAEAGESGLLAGIPVALRDRLSAGQGQPEHRRVTVAFVRFQGVDGHLERDGPASAARAIEDLIGGVQAAVDRHGVSFLGTDIDRDGGKILLTSGAPATDGQHEERMLLALRAVAAAAQPFPVHVGVHTGNVFAGDIGPAYRRTYSVMGDAVNLAARLAARASPGEIIATSGVLAGSRTTFAATPLESFTVKGRRDAVDAVRVGPPTGSRSAGVAGTLPLVGREAELDVFDRAVAAARRDRGCAIESWARPGSASRACWRPSAPAYRTSGCTRSRASCTVPPRRTAPSVDFCGRCSRSRRTPTTT